MKSVIYKETERVPLLHGVIPIFIAIFLLLAGIGMAVYYTPEAKQNPGLWDFVIPVIIASLVAVLFYMMKLELVLTADNIRFRFFPFINTYRVINRKEVARLEVKKYKPLSSFGGWGVRYSLFENCWAYTVAGKRALYVYKKNGKKLVIGTRNAEELQKAVNKFMQKEE